MGFSSEKKCQCPFCSVESFSARTKNQLLEHECSTSTCCLFPIFCLFSLLSDINRIVTYYVIIGKEINFDDINAANLNPLETKEEKKSRQHIENVNECNEFTMIRSSAYQDKKLLCIFRIFRLCAPSAIAVKKLVRRRTLYGNRLMLHSFCVIQNCFAIKSYFKYF